MKKNYIYACVEELIEKYNTSDPFELMDALDIHALQSAKSSRRMSWVILFFIQTN